MFISQANPMLTDMYEDPEKRIDKLEEAAPINTIGKERHGRGRASSWILVIWELIIEHLVNGNPLLQPMITSRILFVRSHQPPK